MKRGSMNDRLEEEKEKLIKLLHEVKKNGIPIIKSDELMVQNQKVDALLVKIQKKKIRRRRNS